METTMSIVMPVYNAEKLLPRVLPPLLEELAAGNIMEIIAVDDGSTDGSAAVCREAGVRVIPSGGRLGPGACRNMGVEEARGALILFVDSDVIAQAGVPGTARAVFEAEPDVVALFGSYDAVPDARSWVSTYRNLLHHSVHQRGDTEASTFWAGLGAVRKDAFQDVGGFDAVKFERPSIEDIELGYRLRKKGGRIRLCKDMQGTHLKRWTFASMFMTDVFKRAIPWARLLNEKDQDSQHLNLTNAERAKALVGSGFWASLVLGIFWPPALIAAGVLLLVGWAANRSLFRLVRQRGGVGNMLAAVVLHQFYYLYSCAAFAWSTLERIVGGRSSRAATAPSAG